jgi:hypothetical protein
MALLLQGLLAPAARSTTRAVTAEPVKRSALWMKRPWTSKKRLWLATLVVLIGVGVGAYLRAWLAYPSDRTPEGAYLRVMSAVNRGKPEDFFAYLETEAQHACFTIGDYRKRSRELVQQSYPEAERAKTLELLGDIALHPDGPEVFTDFATQRKWLDALRRDLSGVSRVEIQGERATVETIKGTRYPFRRRENGIWGLTLFTPELSELATRAARDFALHESAAADYQRATR